MSGRQQRESQGIGKGKRSDKGTSKAGGTDKDGHRDKGARKQRTAALGRALRSVYDDTLREAVPDEFSDLLGKLT